MVNIIVKGILDVPEWAGTCPVCGHLEEEYKKEPISNPMASSSYDVRIQCVYQNIYDIPEQTLAATFTCKECGTKWQWWDKNE